MANDFNLDQFPLPKDWTRQELIDCTEDGNISYGIVQPGKHLDEGIPVLRVNNIGNNSLDLDAVMKVDPKIEEKYLRTRLLGGEVLLTLVGSTGQSIIAPEYMKGWNVARAIAVIRADENIGADWINICLQSRETHHYLNSRANTTVQKTLNLKDVRSIPIPIPPLKTKLFIENIATSLSKKIELNRQMNETLEAMAQALFKSWFVDFDPVIDNALAAGNAIPDTFAKRAEQRKGIEKKDHSDTQNLFPDEFEFTEEMGWIPKGWVVDDISTLCEKIQSGGTPRRNVPEYWEDSTIPWLTSGEVKQTIIIKAENKISESGLSNSSAKWLTSGATVVAMYGATAGQVAYIDKPLTTNQAVCGLIPKKGYQFFNYVTLSRAVAHFEGRATGSAQQNINKGMIENTRVVVPSSVSSDSFEEHCEVIFSKWVKNLHENETLAKIRDTLLPKLISGELYIADAAALVDEAI